MRINYKENHNKAPLLMKLDFFAESSGEKTEKPTPKKKEKSRQEGQVAKSQEISTALSLIVVFSSIGMFASTILYNLQNVFFVTFNRMLNVQDINDLHFAADITVFMFMQIIIICAPILIIALLVGIAVNLFQVGWHPTSKPLKPKFSKLNPISGFKRIFSMRAILELFKSLFKFVIIVMVIYSELSRELENISTLASLPLVVSFQYIGELIIRLGIVVGVWFILIAALDFSYQKFKHNKDLKMTKQETKEEYKQAEGNPQVKGKIRQKMREASMRRMMQDIPQADVIITNPTHFAVGIKYDRMGVGAPKVIAKGADHLAKRIKDIAKENNISIIENKQLARALYATVDVGKEIPPELYKAVAEILAFVYKLKNKV